jgi:DNA-binding MarR family transcriptional regulator
MAAAPPRAITKGPGRNDRRPERHIATPPTPAQDRVLRLLALRSRDAFGPSWTLTRHLGGYTDSTHRDHLMALVRRGFVERRSLRPETRRTVYAYRVTPAGQAYVDNTPPLAALRRARARGVSSARR